MYPILFDLNDQRFLSVSQAIINIRYREAFSLRRLPNDLNSLSFLLSFSLARQILQADREILSGRPLICNSSYAIMSLLRERRRNSPRGCGQDERAVKLCFGRSYIPGQDP